MASPTRSFCSQIAFALATATLIVAPGCDRNAAPEPAGRAAPAPSPSPLPAASGVHALPAAHPPPGTPGHAQHPPVGAPAQAKTSDLSWTDPEGWQRARAGGMRLATYTVPKVAGDPEDAELAVFYFGPGAAGGIEANVDRWIGQFQGLAEGAVKRDQRNVAGLSQHIVEIESGTFKSGMPRGPQTPRENYAMLAAIVEAPTGAHFFKMTGPSKTVSAARPAFMKLLDSVKIGK